ncbi:MAG: diguanylate cyclase [Gemmatimonadota bacterium]
MSSKVDVTEPPALADPYRVLLEIGHALTRSLSDDELYAALYRETARVIDADGFYISLYDSALDRATVVFWGEGGEARRAQIPYQGSDSEVIRTGEPVMVSDQLEDQSLVVLENGGKQATRSAISAPMRVRGKLIGVISAQSYRTDAYSAAELELLAGIADLAAVASQNVLHLATLERRRREAENMEEIVRALVSSLDVEEVLARVAATALDLLEADEAIVWLLGEGTARVAAGSGSEAPEVGGEIPFEGEWARILLEEQRTIRLEDLHGSDLLPPEVRARLHGESALIAPLKIDESVTGALFLGMNRDQEPSEEDAHLLQRLAGHAAVALKNARLHAQLQTLSLTDPLTKLPNRRHLEMHLAREFAAARRGRRLSVVLFDLDNFKQYNDAFGHLAGDGVLEAMGEVLSAATRAMNLVARYGGDEFVSVLSDTSADGARLHAARVSDQVARHPALGPHGIGVTSGVAEFSKEMENVRDLFRTVDEDLYRAKAARDRP